MTEKELILASQKGSQTAYEELVRLHQKAIYYFVLFLCGNDETAETVARGVFVTAWHQIGYLEKLNRSFIALLTSIAAIDCEQYVKRQKRRIGGSIRLGDDVTTVPQVDIFLEKLSTLPFHRRRIFLMRDLCGLSVVEISDILNTPAEEITAELDAAAALCISCADILPKLPAVPNSFSHQVSSFILDRVNDESPISPAKLGKRFAFGKFTIIAACIALLLLAYSGGFMGGSKPNIGNIGSKPQQSQQQKPSAPDSTPSADDSAAAPEDDVTADPQPQPEQPVEPDGGGEVILPGDENQPSTDSGVGTEDTTSDAEQSLIPAGETYSAVYSTSTAAAAQLANLCSGSFRASLPNGEIAVYYMVPSANLEAALAALDSSSIAYTAYDAPDSVTADAPNTLFILLEQ